MTAPDARPGGFDGNARGLMVLVVALVVGFLLLLNAGGDGSETTGTASATSSTIDLGGVDAPDETPDDDTTTTSTSEPATAMRNPSEVQVIVLNGSGPDGAGAATSGTLGQAGYDMLPATNGPATETTTVFFQDDFEAEATGVALVLGRTPDVVQSIDEASLDGLEGTANVVVLLGADTPPVGDTGN